MGQFPWRKIGVLDGNCTGEMVHLIMLYHDKTRARTKALGRSVQTADRCERLLMRDLEGEGGSYCMDGRGSGAGACGEMISEPIECQLLKVDLSQWTSDQNSVDEHHANPTKGCPSCQPHSSNSGTVIGRLYRNLFSLLLLCHKKHRKHKSCHDYAFGGREWGWGGAAGSMAPSLDKYLDR